MDLLLLFALGLDGSPSASVGVRERVLGLEAGVVMVDDIHGWQSVATITGTLPDTPLRGTIGAGRVWWDEPRGVGGSAVNYALFARAEWHGSAPLFLELRHYSTGKRLLGEQRDHFNPEYNGLFLGTLLEF